MKNITFRYFTVDYTAGLTSSDSLVMRLIGKLNSSASDRLMPINKQESDKSDLISDFYNVGKGKMITGTCLRIVNSKEVPIITEEMLKQEQFKVSTINPNAKEKEKTCLDYFFFCLSNDQLIVTLDQRISISRFETYLNWLLNTKETGEIISFAPVIDAEKIAVSDIKSIKFNTTHDLIQSNDVISEDLGIKSRLITVTQDLLKQILSNTDTLEELMNENICSADLVVKFSRPRKMTKEAYREKTAGLLLKSLDNQDCITFQAKDKKVKGSAVLKTEAVDVDCDDNGAISEQSVYQELIKRMLK
ncbi:MAG: hypothetical protein J6Q34_04200 [Bacteroidales bacterium]|nr:hypothetical protein [Bacteroidales bacterium]